MKEFKRNLLNFQRLKKKRYVNLIPIKEKRLPTETRRAWVFTFLLGSSPAQETGIKDVKLTVKDKLKSEVRVLKDNQQIADKTVTT